MKGNIDLDLIVYKVGSVADGRHYKYGDERFGTQKELLRHWKTNDIKPIEMILEKDPVSWEECKKITVSCLEEILEEFSDYTGYLTGKGNFRYSIATILPYKGSRLGVEKPHHYDAIRQFLVDVYDAKVSVNMEADDMLGINQTDSTWCASTDKDLDVVPGHHYNWDTGKFYEMSVLDSDRKFFKQMLTGDTTDDILGLYNVGPKSAYCKAVDKMEDVKDMYDMVKEEYVKRFGSYWELFFKENAQLLWILQERECPIKL